MAIPKQHQRHNEILERLHSGETLSISQLATEWNTTTKTVQRDFAKLMEGNYGIIRADDGKRFVLARERSISGGAGTTLKVLDSLSAQMGGAFYVKAQTTLRQLQHYNASPFYANMDMEDISENLDLIGELERAIDAKRTISFRYKKWYDPDHIKHYQNVHPYKIIIFDGYWYLLIQYKNYYQKLYLKAIRELTVQKETFTIDETILARMERAVNIYFDLDEEFMDVTLLVEQDAIVYFERKPLPGQHLRHNIDGTAELSLRVTHEEEIFYLLKRWLPQLRVIEPISLQEKFDGLLRNYLGEG